MKRAYEILPIGLVAITTTFFLVSGGNLNSLLALISSLFFAGLSFYLIHNQIPNYSEQFKKEVSDLKDHKEKSTKAIEQLAFKLADIESKYAKVALKEFSKDTFKF